MDMHISKYEDGHRVWFESAESFDTIEECIEFGKGIFKKINDCNGDEILDVEINLDDEGILTMHVDVAVDEL